MRRRMRKPRRLKIGHYYADTIDIIEYLSEFPGSKAKDNIGDMELNKTLLNSMPNGRSKQAYVQGFYCRIINFKRL